MAIATSVGPRTSEAREAGTQGGLSDAVIGTFVYGEAELRLHAHSGAVVRKLGRETYARTRRQPPVPVTPPGFFVGRAAELSTVVHPIAAGKRVLFELTGRDGIGKTTFLRQLMTDPALASLDGIVRAEGTMGRDDILQRAFDAAYEGERRFMPLGAQREQLLHDVRLLFLIDDFAGTEEDAAHLTAVAHASSFIFVTSAPRLSSVAQTLELHALNTDDAQALSAHTMADRTNAGAPPGSETSLTAILSSTPLEIVQSAALAADSQSPPATGDQLQDQLVTTISATENVLLSALVVTGGGPLGPKMIGRLAGLPNAMPMLESLERRGVIDFDGERYRLRPSILERLPVVVTMPRLDGSLTIVEEWLRGQPTEAQIASRAQAVNRLLDRAIEDNRSKEVLVIGPLLADKLILCGQPDRARETLDIVLKAARTIPDRDLEGWSLHQSGTLAFAVGDDAAAQTLLSRSLETRSRLNDELATAATRHNLSLLLGVKANGSAEDTSPAAKKPNRLVIAAIFALCAGLAVLFAMQMFAPRPQAPQTVARPVHHPAAQTARRRQSRPAVAPSEVPVAAGAPAVVEQPRAAQHVAVKPKPKRKHHPAARPAAPPAIAAFYANPATSAAGEYAQLCFNIQNATSASIDGIGAIAARGAHCVTIKPERSETYTLTASNAASSVRAFTTLSVTATTQIRSE